MQPGREERSNAECCPFSGIQQDGEERKEASHDGNQGCVRCVCVCVCGRAWGNEEPMMTGNDVSDEFGNEGYNEGVR